MIIDDWQGITFNYYNFSLFPISLFLCNNSQFIIPSFISMIVQLSDNKNFQVNHASNFLDINSCRLILGYFLTNSLAYFQLIFKIYTNQAIFSLSIFLSFYIFFSYFLVSFISTLISLSHLSFLYWIMGCVRLWQQSFVQKSQFEHFWQMSTAQIMHLYLRPIMRFSYQQSKVPLHPTLCQKFPPKCQYFLFWFIQSCFFIYSSFFIIVSLVFYQSLVLNQLSSFSICSFFSSIIFSQQILDYLLPIQEGQFFSFVCFSFCIYSPLFEQASLHCYNQKFNFSISLIQSLICFECYCLNFSISSLALALNSINQASFQANFLCTSSLKGSKAQTFTAFFSSFLYYLRKSSSRSAVSSRYKIELSIVWRKMQQSSLLLILISSFSQSTQQIIQGFCLSKSKVTPIFYENWAQSKSLQLTTFIFTFSWLLNLILRISLPFLLSLCITQYRTYF